MPGFYASVLALLAATTLSFSQTAPAEVWIGTGTVQARITASGPLMAEIQIPDGDSVMPIFRDIALWMGAIDPAGNLMLSIQQPDTTLSDFRGGFRGVSNSAGVWKVTKAEIEAHRQDFADNGVIDNPIPAIFAWPGWQNPFSVQYNGFAADSLSGWTAAPHDYLFSPAPYQPGKGDFPSLGNIYPLVERQPDEIVFVPFHTRSSSALFPGVSLYPVAVNGHAVFFTFYCDDAAFLDHTVFGYITLEYTSQERLDSTLIGFNLNGDIGSPDDDYLGFIPENSVTYFYNADTAKTGDSDRYPPVAGFDLHQGMINELGLETGTSSVMTFYPANGMFPAAQLAPQLPTEYYHYLNGYWRDGSPLTTGGNGYAGSGQTDYIFPGMPGLAGSWSELTVQNPPGDRQALVSTGPAVRNPGAVERLFFSLNFVPGTASISNQWEALRDYSRQTEDFFFADIFPPETNPFDTLACFQTTAVQSPSRSMVKVFPNPAGDHLQLDAGEIAVSSWVMVDLFGRPVLISGRISPGSTVVSLNTGNLPPGMYLLSGRLTDGSRFSQKIVKL